MINGIKEKIYVYFKLISEVLIQRDEKTKSINKETLFDDYDEKLICEEFIQPTLAAKYCYKIPGVRVYLSENESKMELNEFIDYIINYLFGLSDEDFKLLFTLTFPENEKIFLDVMNEYLYMKMKNQD
jgi:hypothetical protein